MPGALFSPLARLYFVLFKYYLNIFSARFTLKTVAFFPEHEYFSGHL